MWLLVVIMVNELTDQLAKNQFQIQNVTWFNLIWDLISKSEAKYRSKKKWENSTNEAQTKLFFPTVKQIIVTNITILQFISYSNKSVLTIFQKIQYTPVKVANKQFIILFLNVTIYTKSTTFRKNVTRYDEIWHF